MSWTTRFALLVALLGALVFAGVASASITTISGTGKGIERPQGDGIYTLQGTWTDSATGTNGTYAGTLNNSGDYTTCLLFVGCTPSTPPQFRLCNVVSGTITFRAPGKSFTVRFIPTSLFTLEYASFICLDPNDPSVHKVQFVLFNIGPPPFTEGFGTVDVAFGLLRGTSAEAGASGLFRDAFDFASP